MLKAINNIFSGVRFPLLLLLVWIIVPTEKKKTELCQELSLQARDLRFQHSTSLTTRNNCIIIRMEVCAPLLSVDLMIGEIFLFYVLTDLVDQETFCGATLVATPLKTRCVCEEDIQPRGLYNMHHLIITLCSILNVFYSWFSYN